MSKFLYILVVVGMSGFPLFAQNPEIKRTWHWYWGHKGGMDFSNGNMAYDTSSNAGIAEANAVISDLNGNLLFYSDGDTIWNRYHNVMPGGTSILGGNSSYQGAIIVPHPCNDSIYYLFTADHMNNEYYTHFGKMDYESLRLMLCIIMVPG